MSTYRDAASDSGKLGDGNGAQRVRDINVTQDFGPTTIAEQNADGGWNKNMKPEGGQAPSMGYTIGSRGDD